MWGKLSLVINFFFSVIKLARQLPLPLWSERPIPPEFSTNQVEPSAVSETEDRQPMPMIEQQPNNDRHRVPTDNMMNTQWAVLVIGTCFAAIGAALQALQARATLSAASTFPWFCVAFELAFLAMLIAIYVRSRCRGASRVMEHLAVLFGTVAFLLAILMILHPPLKQMSIAFFVIAFIIIILANRSTSDW